ncbi:hypothetical protein J19TS2_28970 [Cohnella xylanilytica]|uniref:hypothetical protein n=1 Tax=Cohnella xylanilytica TaxID=557555 RepID=UPI001B241EC0|nr:hypothetical protein [Cohnella xylanilytica]GIO13342.1 hypothetical protein J19TS2_28970 [Cohnella xylanilytica]
MTKTMAAPSGFRFGRIGGELRFAERIRRESAFASARLRPSAASERAPRRGAAPICPFGQDDMPMREAQ